MTNCLAAAAVLAIAALPAPAAASSDSETIRRLSLEWMQAIERKDRAALERIVASDFTLRSPGTPEAEAVSRSTWIGNAVGRDWSDFRYENFKVEVAGDRALATSQLSFNVSPMPFALDSAIVDQWVRQDGRWQVRTRWLGASHTAKRMAFAGGAVAGLLAAGLIALLLWWRRRRKRTTPA